MSKLFESRAEVLRLEAETALVQKQIERDGLHARIAELEAVARQAMGALESGYWQAKAADALRKTLGEA